MKKGFKPGLLDPTLFTKSYDGELFVCQIYVDDIIQGEYGEDCVSGTVCPQV